MRLLSKTHPEPSETGLRSTPRSCWRPIPETLRLGRRSRPRTSGSEGAAHSLSITPPLHPLHVVGTLSPAATMYANRCSCTCGTRRAIQVNAPAPNIRICWRDVGSSRRISDVDEQDNSLVSQRSSAPHEAASGGPAWLLGTDANGTPLRPKRRLCTKGFKRWTAAAHQPTGHSLQPTCRGVLSSLA